MLKIYQRKDKVLSNIENTTALNKYFPLTGGTIIGKTYISNDSDAFYIANSSLNKDINPTINKYSQVVFHDNAKNYIGAVGVRQKPTGELNTYLAAINYKADGTIRSSEISIIADKEGNINTYAPHPNSEYYNSIATTKWSKDSFAKCDIDYIYVGGDNKSDTADLHNGRGHSADKPFATLDVAWNYVLYHLYRDVVQIRIQEDQVITNAGLINASGTKKIMIVGDNKNIKISNANAGTFLFCAQDLGFLYFSDITLEVTNTTSNGGAVITTKCGGCTYLNNNITIISNNPSTSGLWVDREGHIFSISNTNFTTTFNGSFNCVVNVLNNSKAILFTSFNGNATGKRFNAYNHSQIHTNGKGIECIPGTIAGVVDSTSSFS